MEEIRELGELEFIRTRLPNYQFAAVTVMDRVLYFNIPASRAITMRYARIAVTSDYVILLPASGKSPTSFALLRHKGGFVTMYIPAELKEKKLIRGCRRMFKYKDGYAFPRYEVLE